VKPSDQQPQEPTPAIPEWLASQLARQAAWDDNALARYLTVAGATVDITYASHSGLLIATCTGCKQIERTDTGGLLADPPEKEAARIEKALPESRTLAQAHAEKCRALPKPAATQ
jgi:hypothetical protein